MASMVLPCPHCFAQRIGFLIAWEHRRQPKQSQAIGTKTIACMMICSGCQGGIIGVFEKRHGVPGPDTINQCQSDPRDQGWIMADCYRSPSPPRVPSHVPFPLSSYFAQPVDSLKRGNNDASGMMSRKVVDVSTEELLGQESNNYRDLRGRIDALAANGRITAELQDWAHQIRLGGNDAAHEYDPYSPEEAEEQLDFAELYLTYVYTLPARLAERKARAQAAKAAIAMGTQPSSPAPYPTPFILTPPVALQTGNLLAARSASPRLPSTTTAFRSLQPLLE
jgi:hypothetical protein